MTEVREGPRVRVARLGDAQALRRLYSELADDHPEAQPADDESTRVVLATVLDQANRCLLVAETREGRVVGTLDIVTVPNLTYRARPWAVVENVVVAAEYRRRGLGRALMSEAIGLARAAGCYKVQLHSGKQRVEAHRFYRSLGFEAVAEGFKSYLG